MSVFDSSLTRDHSLLFQKGDNDFSVALYSQLKQQSGNLFFSPFSLRVALAMTYAGARGPTADEMQSALHLASASDHLSEIIERLDRAGGGEYELSVANSLWGQHGSKLEAAFLDIITRKFRSEMSLVDFTHSAEAARLKINEWVEDKTRQKIRKLIPPGGVNAVTRLVLVNAVYFNGKWVTPFDQEDTNDDDFYLENGATTNVKMMQVRHQFQYARGRGYQAVELTYRGRDLSMLILLPDRKDGLRDLESRLSTQMLDDCVSQVNYQEISLFVPRFKITWGTIDLTDTLKALGVRKAFMTSEADFSGINVRRPPDVSPAPGPKHSSFEAAMEAADADGTRSILDIERVSDTPDYGAISPLPEEGVLELFGTDQPTREMIAENDDLFEMLERGQGVYVVAYRDGQPSELYFAGYSYD